MEQRVLQNAKQIVAGVREGNGRANRNNQNFCSFVNKKRVHIIYSYRLCRGIDLQIMNGVAPIHRCVVFGLFYISFVQISRLLLIILIDNHNNHTVVPAQCLA